MSEVILIVTVEILFIVLLLVVVIISWNWKRKKISYAAWEKLLDVVTEQEQDRKIVLVNYLTGHQKMAKQAAVELCEDFVEAEKQFMYRFLEQQIKQMPIAGFYQNLCDLLDQYLNLLPEGKDASVSSVAEIKKRASEKVKMPEIDWE